MTIYIDNEYKCHVADAGNMVAVETDFFDGKCSDYIEGYRYVPEGETWTREDGEVFSGLMITPWRDYGYLDSAQQGYEEALAAADQQIAALVDEIYNMDMEGIYV